MKTAIKLALFIGTALSPASHGAPSTLGGEQCASHDHAVAPRPPQRLEGRDLPPAVEYAFSADRER